jgi:hypothetical protein
VNLAGLNLAVPYLRRGEEATADAADDTDQRLAYLIRVIRVHPRRGRLRPTLY